MTPYLQCAGPWAASSSTHLQVAPAPDPAHTPSQPGPALSPTITAQLPIELFHLDVSYELTLHVTKKVPGFSLHTGFSPSLPISGLGITTQLIVQVRSVGVILLDFPSRPENPAGSTPSVPLKRVHPSPFPLTSPRLSPSHPRAPGLLQVPSDWSLGSAFAQLRVMLFTAASQLLKMPIPSWNFLDQNPLGSSHCI